MSGFATPIVFFLFNRPEHVRCSFDRIRALKPKRLFLVADGPRTPVETALCEEARAAALEIDWSCDVQTEFSEVNLGCRRRITSGLSWAFLQCEELIILEDDCIADPSFFRFCGELLERFRDEPRIMAISGNNFQGGAVRGDGSYFFSKYFHIWGWASWRRAWEHYEPNVESYGQTRNVEDCEAMFDSVAEREFWSGVFERCYRRELDTWDYQWMYSCWKRGGLCVQPGINLVTNIGCSPELSKLPHGRCVDAVEAHSMGEIIHPSAISRDVEADKYSFRNLFEPGKATSQANIFGRLKQFYTTRWLS